MRDLHSLCTHYNFCVCSPKMPTYQDLEKENAQLRKVREAAVKYLEAEEDDRDEQHELCEAISASERGEK
jgi:hypothetical protein